MKRLIWRSTVAVVAVSTGYALYKNDFDPLSIGIVRISRAAATVASIAVDYKMTMNLTNSEAEDYALQMSGVHQRSADRMLKLAHKNGGCYIKVGQHLSSLDYLLPMEYIRTLSSLLKDAPLSSFEDIKQVLLEDLGKKADNFVEIDPKPIGSASLAQVHKAKLSNGQTVALKVQHRRVKQYSAVDIFTMNLLVHAAAKVFPEFKLMWFADEVKRNLPRELNFKEEGENADRIRHLLENLKFLKIPEILWDLSTDRVLTMQYFEGGLVNDLKYLNSHGISPYDVSRKLSLIFSEMIFVHGDVHCDPHPGNILVRKDSNGQTEIVLLDHGLYTKLDEKFRLNYARLWLSLLHKDRLGIERWSKALGVGDLYPLFACMVTARSWKAIIRGIKSTDFTAEENDDIKTHAASYIPEIAEVLNSVPRQMIMVFKANDLLRTIEFKLGTQKQAYSYLNTTEYCLNTIYGYAYRRSDNLARGCLVWIAWTTAISGHCGLVHMLERSRSEQCLGVAQLEAMRNNQAKLLQLLRRLYNHRSSDDGITVHANVKPTPKSRPLLPGKTSGKRFTVPKPFKMTIRDEMAPIRATYANRFTEALLEEKNRKQAEHIAKAEFKASPVPASTYLPLYEQLTQAESSRRQFLLQHRHELLQTALKPFKLSEARNEIHLRRCRSAAMANSLPQISALPLRPTSTSHDMQMSKQVLCNKKKEFFDKQQHFVHNGDFSKDTVHDEGYRRQQLQKRHRLCNAVQPTFQPRKSAPVPNFKQLHSQIQEKLNTRKIQNAHLIKVEPFALKMDPCCRTRCQANTRMKSEQKSCQPLRRSRSLLCLSREPEVDLASQFNKTTLMRIEMSKERRKATMRDVQNNDKSNEIKSKLKKQLKQYVEDENIKQRLRAEEKKRKLKLDSIAFETWYKDNLAALKNRIHNRPTLLEQQKALIAKQSLENRFNEILKEAGISKTAYEWNHPVNDDDDDNTADSDSAMRSVMRTVEKLEQRKKMMKRDSFMTNLSRAKSEDSVSMITKSSSDDWDEDFDTESTLYGKQQSGYAETASQSTQTK
ncbi:putative aarF domain-containing protein kinase 1 -like protein [Trichinella pseudospiralis]|uniref:Putative aarF domain-containing protein kinase 1-like protein n=1 Tax=Trichinella pseudospiralis TaxID=6337 RepID=A0A0V1FHD6_TRIPS|nr:putative aarF domain-containing protein kinase 1 -like protein [Trichinella pseudospiralis]